MLLDVLFYLVLPVIYCAIVLWDAIVIRRLRRDLNEAQRQNDATRRYARLQVRGIQKAYTSLGSAIDRMNFTDWL